VFLFVIVIKREAEFPARSSAVKMNFPGRAQEKAEAIAPIDAGAPASRINRAKLMS